MIQLSSHWQLSPPGDAQFLMLGHIKVGEITRTSIGTWLAYYRATERDMRSLKDFPSADDAKSAVEAAVFNAAKNEAR